MTIHEKPCQSTTTVRDVLNRAIGVVAIYFNDKKFMMTIHVVIF